jgi:regulator of protease activity HflC (stomatin/prohibitin superfamily)
MTTPNVNRNSQAYQPVDNGIDPHEEPFSQHRDNEKIRELSCCLQSLWHTAFCCCLPFTCCCSVKTVKPMHDTIVSRCGIPNYILRQPGPHCVGFCCTDTEDVYLGLKTVEIKNMTAADDHGSPIVISAQFVYRVIDSIAATYRTNHLHQFLVEQAESALRAVVGTYPFDIDRNDTTNKQSRKTKKNEVPVFEEDDGNVAPTPCLAKQSTVIDNQLVKVFQLMVDFTGVKIETFRLISVGYPEKMEKLLLARQEAQAQVIARKTIAEGTSGIIEETLTRLKTLGIRLTESEQNRFATNLTLLLVNHGHTTINIFDGGNNKV